MDKETFVEICQICFGERWVAPAARAIGYTSRQIHRMASGEVPIRPVVAATIIVIAKQKKDRLEKIIDKQGIENFLVKRQK